MAETRGIVRKIDGKKVIVSTSQGGCHSCPLSKFCSINNIDEVEAIMDEELKVGDRVRLHNSDSKLIIFSFVLFIVPLIILVSVYALLGNTLKEIIRILIALLATGMYFIALGIVEKRIKERFILPHAKKDI